MVCQEGVAGFFYKRPDLCTAPWKRAALTFSSMRMLTVIHGLCLGYVCTVTVKEYIVDALIDEASD